MFLEASRPDHRPKHRAETADSRRPASGALPAPGGLGLVAGPTGLRAHPPVENLSRWSVRLPLVLANFTRMASGLYRWQPFQAGLNAVRSSGASRQGRM